MRNSQALTDNSTSIDFLLFFSTGACPNDCNGHGACRLLSELETTVPYHAWDSEQIQACVCDAGFFDTDCSQRRCPTGDDPLTLCDDANKGMVQEIRVTLGSGLNYDPTTFDGASRPLGIEGMDLFGTSQTLDYNDIQDKEDRAQLHIGATDNSGQVYYAPSASKSVFAKDSKTRQKIVTDGGDGASQVQKDLAAKYKTMLNDPGVDSMELVLENIPGFKVRNVKVSGSFTSPEDGGGIQNVLEKRFVVTFIPDATNSANFGLQNDLVCDSAYGCGSSGCQPTVIMPFLYRYAATVSEQSSVDTFPVLPSPAVLTFFTGALNSDPDFNAGKFIRLHESSNPRMPPGVSVDTGVTFTNLDRYDIRISIAVQDPADPTNSDTLTDVYWTKVTYTNTNITTDVVEYTSAADATLQTAGVFSVRKSKDFVGTLNGFTYRGFIPKTLSASIPDAPGVSLLFPTTNMVKTNVNYKFFEIVIKLPSCSVSPIIKEGYIDPEGQEIAPISPNVENLECSNRGECNRNTGTCECFEGYFGIACHRQTVLV